MRTGLFGIFDSLSVSDRSCLPSHSVRVDVTSTGRVGLLSCPGPRAESIDCPLVDQARAPLDHVEEEDSARNHRHFHCRIRYRTEAWAVLTKMPRGVMKAQSLSS